VKMTLASGFQLGAIYWKYLKAKLIKNNNELGSVTTQMRLLALNGKKRLSNVMNYDQIIALAKEFSSKWEYTN